MKICCVECGDSIHTQRWVNYFAKKGDEVHLICWEVLPGYDDSIHIHLLTKLAPRIWRISQYLSFLLWLFQVRWLIRKIRPDIVEGHFVTVYGFLAACSGFHPLIIVAWGSDILIAPKQNPLWKFIAKYALGKADLVVCRSPMLKEEISKLGVDPSKIKIILIGVDTDEFHPLSRDAKLRENLGIAASQPVVISTRSLYPVYNVETLVKAIPLILKEIPEAKFIIAGRGEEQSYLENLAQELGISSDVRFIGWVSHDRLPEYLALADVYVSTSLSDGTSNSLLEAMACEIAPVVTDLPANRGWVTDSENGFIVAVADTRALAERIIYLIKDKELRKRFGKISREIIKDKAEYHKEMEKREKIYQELIRSTRG